jgi:predicted small secreted protein
VAVLKRPVQLRGTAAVSEVNSHHAKGNVVKKYYSSNTNLKPTWIFFDRKPRWFNPTKETVDYYSVYRTEISTRVNCFRQQRKQQWLQQD